ncbi:MAG: DUF4012 domain-containing protein [Candidatus Magasanikbacteria bacterium]|nr:DUF4012 domain-containing protein [Candidatus Magasanikbacteria bacterium]
MVRAGQGSTPSPHVIHLRDTKREDAWRVAPVYQEKVSPPTQRVVMDAAAAVRLSRAAPAGAVVWTDWCRRQVFGVFVFVRQPNFVYALAAVILFFGLPFPAVGYYRRLQHTNARVVEESTRAFFSLQSATVAALSSEIPAAEQDLAAALNSFAVARSLLENDQGVVLSLAKLLPVIGTEVSSRQELLQAGHHLALGNTYVVKGIDDAQRATDLAVTDRFGIIRNHLRSALPQYTEALDHLEKVDPKAIPSEYQKTFKDFKVLYATLVGDMGEMIHLLDALNIIFGDNSLKRYLIVFQNQHELRPTGGFMGSFALLDMQKGRVVHLDVPGGGTYDLQGQLSVFVKPPTPVQLVNGRWEFQDANWFPDFFASAKKIQWFYGQARGRTVDGVIAVNASVAERLLRVIGTVENERLGSALEADTVLSTLQKEVEGAAAKQSGQPKAVLAELAKQFFARLQNLDRLALIRLLGELHAALAQKEIQVALNEPNLQQVFRDFGWTGEILQPPVGADYLMINQANIAGEKSDAKIAQTIEHQAVVTADGRVVNTVTIRRTHTGKPEEALYGSSNISYVRAYVPSGATLLDAGGFTYPPEDVFHVPEPWYAADADLATTETDEQFHIESGTRMTKEFGKTVFGNWVVTAPGETTEVYFTYELPFRVWSTKASADRLSRYRLFVQKQSGVTSRFSTQIIYPEGWTPVWRSDEGIDLAKNGARYETTLLNDRALGLVMEAN